MSEVRNVISIGNFDGVHLGHQSLIHRMQVAAEEREAKTGIRPRLTVLTFDPRPGEILRPELDFQRFRLSNPKQRECLLKAAGADQVDIIKPTLEWLKMSPASFMSWLWEKYRPCHIVEGDNFFFGHQRQGNMKRMMAFAQDTSLWTDKAITDGFTVEIAPPVIASQTDQWEVLVSSSHIRKLLASGRVMDAQKLLGRPYSVTGTVVPGEQRGRKQGVPTINIALDPSISSDHPPAIDNVQLPCEGVYGGVICLDPDPEITGDEDYYLAAISIGKKPTFHGPEARLETILEAHIIDNQFDAEKVDATNVARATVRFDRYIRGQYAFPDGESLVKQILKDVQKIKRYQSLAI